MQNARRSDPRRFRNNPVNGSAAEYGEVVTAYLRREYGPLKSAAKILARVADVTVRTAENWIGGLCAPQGAPLLRLMANDPAFRAEIEALLDQIHERQRAAAGTSHAITARHRSLVAALDAPVGAAVPTGGGLVSPTGDVVAFEGGSFVVSAAYVGVERRRTPR